MFYVCVLTAFWDKNCICDIHFYVFVSFGKASVQFSLSEITKMGIEGTERWGNAFISSLPSRSYPETEKWNKTSGTHFISVWTLSFIAWESQSHILDTTFLWCLYPTRNRDQLHYSLSHSSVKLLTKSRKLAAISISPLGSFFWGSGREKQKIYSSSENKISIVMVICFLEGSISSTEQHPNDLHSVNTG